MDRACYLREIEALVQHLSPQAHLLGDMDLHVIEEFFEGGIPLEAALAGIRHGAERLSRLKRPPRGLPLTRLRRDVERAAREPGSPGGTPGGTTRGDQEPPTTARATPEIDESWRDVVRGLADETTEPAAAALRALGETGGLGEERAFVRFVAISRDHYRRRLAALDEGEREALRREVAAASADVLTGMSSDAREDLLAELVRRRLMAQDPVLDPRRFWQD